VKKCFRYSIVIQGMQVDVAVCLVIPASCALLYMVLVIIEPSPWFSPQYTVPLVGMMLGNSLNGVTVGLKSFLESLSSERAAVEWALTLGATRWEAVGCAAAAAA
jgi:putative ABC transport system permease protein